MTKIQKDWFDKHVTVMTLNDDKETEKKIKKSLKKTFIKDMEDEVEKIKKGGG